MEVQQMQHACNRCESLQQYQFPTMSIGFHILQYHTDKLNRNICEKYYLDRSGKVSHVIVRVPKKESLVIPHVQSI